MTNEQSNDNPTEAETRKTKLEAQLLEIELVQKQAEGDLRELTLKKQEAELKRSIAEINLSIERGKRREENSQIEDAHYRRNLLQSEAGSLARVYDFDDHVDELSARNILKVLRGWERDDKVDGEQRDILIRLKSPGGSVIDGFDIFDHIKGMQSRGYTVDTEATGIAASMAGVLLQAGTKRVINRNAFLHLHEVSTMSFGKAAELKDSLDFTKALQDRMCEIYAERSDGVHTPETVLALFERREIYLKANEALEHGFVDEVR